MYLLASEYPSWEIFMFVRSVELIEKMEGHAELRSNVSVQPHKADTLEGLIVDAVPQLKW